MSATTTIVLGACVLMATALDDTDDLARWGAEYAGRHGRHGVRYRVGTDALRRIIDSIDGCPANSGFFGEPGSREPRACRETLVRLRMVLLEMEEVDHA